MKVGAASAVVAVALFAPAIFFGQVPLYRDFSCTFLPFKLYAARALAEGRLPLWSREYSFGVPFLANYQSGVLYPPSAIVYALPNPTGIGLYLAAHFWIAGFGMSRLLARRGVGRRAEAFGALAWMLGGLMVSIAAWSHLAVVAWLPLSVVAAEDLVRRPRRSAFLVLTAIVTLQALGGAPESFAQSIALTAAAAWLARREASARWRTLAVVAVAASLALLLSAVQLLPTYEYFHQTTRSTGLASSAAMDQSLDPRTLLTLLVPHRLDRGVMSMPLEGRLPLFWSIYMGILPLGFALVGAATRRGRRWAVLLALGLVLAFGPHTPVYAVLYAAAPRLFGAFRFPEKFLVSADFAAVVLSAIGLGSVEARLRRRHGAFAALLSGAALLLTLGDLWQVHAPALLFGDWASLSSSAAAPLVGEGFGARVFHYQQADPGLRRWVPRIWPGRDLRARETELWAELLPDVPLVYGLDFVNGNDALSIFRPEVVALEATSSAVPVSQALHLLRALAVRFATGETPIDDPAAENVQRAGPRRAWIYRLREPAPRIYLARRFRRVGSAAEAFRSMAGESFVPGEDAAVVEPIGGRDSGELGAGTASVLIDAADEQVVRTDLLAAGLLVIGDSDFPGWRAQLDDRPARILRANGIARAVEVPGGSHHVTMRYAPRSFRLGAEISAAALVALVAVLAWPAWRRASPP